MKNQKFRSTFTTNRKNQKFRSTFCNEYDKHEVRKHFFATKQNRPETGLWGAFCNKTGRTRDQSEVLQPDDEPKTTSSRTENMSEKGPEVQKQLATNRIDQRPED
jgi:hypothetical protein